MRQFHKPKDEKRIIVILPRGQYGDCWVLASTIELSFWIRLVMQTWANINILIDSLTPLTRNALLMVI